MNEQGSVQLVCFDLGGVIVRLRPDWNACCAAAGVRAPGITTEMEERLERLIHMVQVGRIDANTFAEWGSVALDGSIRPDEVLAAHDKQVNGEYAGLEDIITRIHQAGVKTACLSNTDARHWECMTGYAALHSLQHHFASHLIEARKPDAKAFEIVENELQIPGSAIVYFDDTLINVEAAADRGWRACHVDPSVPTAPQIIDHLEACGVVPVTSRP